MRAEPEAIAGDEPGRPQWLAGYHVLRRLGSGSRATVYLAHGGDSADGVAIKAFEHSVAAESLDAEVDALSGTSSPHVVRMLDIAIAPGRPPCIVLQRLTGGSLAALLSRGPALTAGAAVTVLVSVARGLAALHDAGFDHEHVSPTRVLFDGTGRPVLIGLGHAVPITHGASASPPGPASPAGQGGLRRPAGLAGLAGLARLVRTVFDHVDDRPAAHRAEELARWLEGASGDASTWAEVEDRLFDLAGPEPVLHRGQAGADPSIDAAGEHESPPVRAALGRLGASGAPAARRGAAHASRDDPPWWAHGEAVKQTVLAALRQRRRPLAVAGAVGAALLVLALAVLPVNGRSGASGARPSTPAGNTGPPHRLASTDATKPAASSPAVSPGAPTTEPQAAAAAVAAIRADEPVAATDALLALRRACLRTTSPSCLAGVDQDGSPLLQADRSLMDSHRAGETYEGYETSLIQQSGGSALIALAPPRAAETPKPASALVIEGEAGWRLREVFAD